MSRLDNELASQARAGPGRLASHTDATTPWTLFTCDGTMHLFVRSCGADNIFIVLINLQERYLIVGRFLFSSPLTRPRLIPGLTLKARTGCYLLSWDEDACRSYLCGVCELVFMIYWAYKDVITTTRIGVRLALQTCEIRLMEKIIPHVNHITTDKVCFIHKIMTMCSDVNRRVLTVHMVVGCCSNLNCICHWKLQSSW